MANLNEMFPSRFLKGSDFQPGQEFLVTMAQCTSEAMSDGSQQWGLMFDKAQKGLVLNQTNGQTIGGLYGDDTESWIGKQLVLFTMKVQGPKGIVDGIRVRAPQDNEKAAPPEAPPVPVADADAALPV